MEPYAVRVGGALINQGTLLGSLTGRLRVASTLEVFNQGLLQVANSGHLDIENLSGNVGATSLGDSGHLEVAGAGLTVAQPIDVPSGTRFDEIGRCSP